MIRGTKRPRIKAVEIIESKAQKIDAKLSANMHNRFDIEVVDAKTGEVKQRGQALNVICNQLWTRLLTPGAYFSAIHYGSGSGTPAAADTSLFTFAGYENNFLDTTYGHDIEKGVRWCRRKVQIAAETAVGVTITEVGIAYGTSISNLCTHAMLQDMNGNQISIEKTGTDVINIYATVFIHYPAWNNEYGVIFPASDIYGNEGSEDNGLFTWLFGVKWTTSGNDNMRFTYAYPSWGSNNPLETYYSTLNPSIISTNITPTYDAAGKKIVLTLSRAGVTLWNLDTGILGILLCIWSQPKFGNDVVYLNAMGNWWPGTTVTGEAIGTGDGSTTDFSTKFSLPENATIYVDGSPVSAQVDNVPLEYTEMGLYFTLVGSKRKTFKYISQNYSAPYVSTGKGSDSGVGTYGEAIYYNPFYSLGIDSFYAMSNSDLSVYVSDDLIEWTQIGINSYSTNAVPIALRTKKFWKVCATRSGSGGIVNLTCNSLTGKNIHFDTPPAEGAVITADYTTKTLAKDANHVFDLTVTIQLGEYTE